LWDTGLGQFGRETAKAILRHNIVHEISYYVLETDCLTQTAKPVRRYVSHVLHTNKNFYAECCPQEITKFPPNIVEAL